MIPPKRTMPLNPSCFKVLFAILYAGKPLTLRELAALCGWKSSRGDWIIECLDRLQEHGLAKREIGKKRTIVPTCRFIPADKL